jgi:nitroimidazol reductase NimA-like FMN-containing flavoprotein (pyridoxamine 5'-phosphate oxidase superfamily)
MVIDLRRELEGMAMVRPLTETEARELIGVGKIGHLGCLVNGEPYVVPINYVFEEGAIYSHSLPGLKIDAMREQRRTCLQVEEIEDNFNWRSALVYGDFEEIRVPSDRRSVLNKLLAKFPLLTPVESVMADDASAPDSIVFRIVIDRITGVGEGSFREVSDEKRCPTACLVSLPDEIQ